MASHRLCSAASGWQTVPEHHAPLWQQASQVEPEIWFIQQSRTKSSLEDIQAWYIRGKPLICTEGQSEKSYFLLKRQLAITPACGGHTHQEQTQKARDTSAVPGAGDISGNTHSWHPPRPKGRGGCQ